MAAAFVLGINMFVAGIFALAFGAVAVTNRTVRGAGWVSAGYAAGVLNVLLEFGLPRQVEAVPFAVSIYLVFLAALALSLIGLADHYRVTPPWRTMMAIGAASCLAAPVIFTLPYGSGSRALLYQMPYVAMQSLIGWTILRSGRRQVLDLLLVALNGAAALIYLTKPLLARSLGPASTPQGYITTDYAAFSQSLGSVIIVALALLLLLIMMRDTVTEMQAHAEMDALSGVLNRGGFDAHATRMLARAQRSDDCLTLVTADLDHFKKINDDFGHATGDQVIAHFAALLRQAAPTDAVVGRLGGEEFGVVLGDADLASARRYAESVRAALAAQPLSFLGHRQPTTASFGVAQMGADDSLSDLTRRADAALYRAKTAGRNRVSLAPADVDLSPDVLKPNRLLTLDAS